MFVLREIGCSQLGVYVPLWKFAKLLNLEKYCNLQSGAHLSLIRNDKIRIAVILHEVQESLLPKKRRFQTWVTGLEVVHGERNGEAGSIVVDLVCNSNKVCYLCICLFTCANFVHPQQPRQLPWCPLQSSNTIQQCPKKKCPLAGRGKVLCRFKSEAQGLFIDKK